MPMRRPDKVSLTEDYSSMLENISGMTVFDYRGLTVEQVTELRQNIREAGGNMKVVKNRMLKRALEGKPYDTINEILTGPNAVVFAGEDPVKPAKAVVDFAKNHETVQIKGGMVSERYIDAAGVDQLSKTPPMEELHAKILGGIKAPASNILGGVKGLHNKLHGLMVSYKDKLENAA